MVLSIKEKLDRLLKKFLPRVIKSIEIDWELGSAISITNAKLSGKKTNMSPLNISKKDKELNINMLETLIKDINSVTAKKIDYLVDKSVSEKWSTEMLKKELENLNIDEFYKGRIDNIAKTESARMMNTSINNTAVKRLGAKKKYLYNVVDGRTGDDSIVSQNKYGTEEQAIDVNKPFKYTYNGKTREFLFPPDRPRDRSICIYVFED